MMSVHTKSHDCHMSLACNEYTHHYTGGQSSLSGDDSRDKHGYQLIGVFGKLFLSLGRPANNTRQNQPLRSGLLSD